MKFHWIGTFFGGNEFGVLLHRVAEAAEGPVSRGPLPVERNLLDFRHEIITEEVCSLECVCSQFAFSVGNVRIVPGGLRSAGVSVAL